MKKSVFFLLPLFTMMMSCTNNQPEGPTDERNIRESELYVYSGSNHVAARNARMANGNIPGVDIPVDDQYNVYFYIRVDGNIPGEEESHLHSGDYFPRKSNGGSVMSVLNTGRVNANVAWKSGRFSKYIYATDGKAVQGIITKEPTLEDLVNANLATTDDFSGYLNKKDSLHFIWYICKKQDSDKCWHIDGILTSIDRTDISETTYGDEIIEKYKDMTKDTTDVNRAGHVEVDIHQQQHKDWNEIKTSIHLRDTVDVDVYLPIMYNQLADDFAIRAGVDYEYVTEVTSASISIGGVTYELSAEITHQPEGITIHIEPNVEALRAAREYYDDGITYEIHSYVSHLVDEKTVWDMLKNATYSVNPYTKLVGQVTSAMFE